MSDAKVFISHGHAETERRRLKDFVRERLGMVPIVLSEQAGLGLTIVEKLERHGRECRFALILLTADDETDSGFRARQNVIHELGFFHGVLGRERVVLLVETGVELPSNISGLIYKEFRRGSVESVFEDIRQAIESGMASRHANSVPKQTFATTPCHGSFNDGDWLTAAFVGPKKAATVLKAIATAARNSRSSDRGRFITAEGQKRIRKLRQQHLAGWQTDEERLDACIAKAAADVLEQEMTNFEWDLGKAGGEDPLGVFTGTVDAFIAVHSARSWGLRGSERQRAQGMSAPGRRHDA